MRTMHWLLRLRSPLPYLRYATYSMRHDAFVYFFALSLLPLLSPRFFAPLIRLLFQPRVLSSSSLDTTLHYICISPQTITTPVPIPAALAVLYTYDVPYDTVPRRLQRAGSTAFDGSAAAADAAYRHVAGEEDDDASSAATTGDGHSMSPRFLKDDVRRLRIQGLSAPHTLRDHCSLW